MSVADIKILKVEPFDSWKSFEKYCEFDDLLGSFRKLSQLCSILSTKKGSKLMTLTKDEISGRIGPLGVGFDEFSANGVKFAINSFMLESLEGLFSIRADVCVFKGKWMYEVTLLTAGLHQLGWATVDCPFSNEDGVGDFPDSFAYDGKRKKKWNVAALEYGETWTPGDIIGVCINLEDREVSFYRNGKNLGVAFYPIRINSKEAVYFPALTLARGERCFVNFGAFCFKYPVENFKPLHCIYEEKENYYKELLELYSYLLLSQDRFNYETKLAFDVISVEFLTLFAEQLSLKTLYSWILPFFTRLLAAPASLFDYVVYIFFSLIPEALISEVIGNIFLYLSIEVHHNFFLPEYFEKSICALKLAINLLKLSQKLSNNKTIQENFDGCYSFFDAMTFFVGFKILNSEDLKLLLPDAWLPSVRSTFPFKENTEFVAWRQKLRNSLNFYRNEQLEFFKLFFNKSCENFFFAWLPSLTQDVTAFHETREFHVAANLFFIILQLLQNTPLTSYIQSFSSLFVLDEPLFTFARLKGTIEHLRAYSDCDSPGASKGDYNVDDLNDDLSVKKRDESEDYRSVFQKSFPSIRYRAKLFNCAVILFHSSLALRYKSFWKELIELKSTQRQLSVLYAKIEGANASNKKPNKYILKTFSLLSEDLRELSRDIMWSEVIMFSEENVYILHNFVLSLLEILSEFSESREFAFIPEYYVDALLNSVLALKKNYESSSKTYLPIAEHVLSFLVHHFGDARICNPDVKEFILQTLCKLLKSEVYLCTLENTSSLKMILMKKFLLAFKSRFWVTVSLALSSLLNGSSPRSSDIYNNELLARPSIVMQKCFQSLAINEPETLNMFINNLFNLSCWVITELFVTLQKLSATVSESLEMADNLALINTLTQESNMFTEITVNLLQHLETVTRLAVQYFSLDEVTGQINTTRLSQLVFHVVQRTLGHQTTEGFDDLLILRPVVSLLANMNAEFGHVFLKQLVSDPGFHMDNIEKVFEKLKLQHDLSFHGSDYDRFSLLLDNIREVYMLKKNMSSEEAEQMGEVCSICCTNTIDRKFEPCGHMSCAQCILRHLLNERSCFFCKKDVLKVIDVSKI